MLLVVVLFHRGKVLIKLAVLRMIDVQGGEPTCPNDALAAHRCGRGIGLVVPRSISAVARERRRGVVLARGASRTGLALIGRNP